MMAPHATEPRDYGPGCSILDLSAVVQGERWCVLRNEHGIHCQFSTDETSLAAFANHILGVHIGAERRLIKDGNLDRTSAQLLFTKGRVHRAEQYAWRCPVVGCYVHMRRDPVRRHSHSHHPSAPVLAFQRGKHPRKGPLDIVQDILDTH
jgi:hypothetical protein